MTFIILAFTKYKYMCNEAKLREYILCLTCLFFFNLQGGKLHSVCEEEEQTDPYTQFQCFTSPTQNIVQALEFCGPDKLISASYGDSYVRKQWDIVTCNCDFNCAKFYPQVHIWDISGFKPVQSVKVSSSVLALAVWSHYLAIGSSVVQTVDMSSDELRRILFVEDSEGIPVCGQL